MILHQKNNSSDINNYNAYFYIGTYWDFHFHRDYEIIYVLEGFVECTVNNKKEIISAGEFGMCLSFEVHSYKPSPDGKYWVCVFSDNYVRSFSSAVSGKVGESFKFVCRDEIRYYIENCLIYSSNTPVFILKSCLYALCGEYLACTKLSDKSKSVGKTEDILKYVENNYKSSITLSDIACYLKYDYHYVSRYFKSNFNMTFTDFINTYRLQSAANLLENSSLKIIDIALECGFKSVRAFNDAFKKQLSCTPSEYRKKINSH